MSDVTERLVPTVSETVSDLQDVRPGSVPVVPIGQTSTDDAETAAARWAVAEYLRDLGLRDPAWIARETETLVRDAQLARNETGCEKRSLAEAAVARTVHQLDQWLAALARSAGEDGEPRRRSRIVGARLPDLLSRYPHALNPRRPDAEIMNTVQRDLTPVVPQPRPRPMRQQKLTLVPSSLRRLLGGVTSFATRTDVDKASPTRSAPRLSKRTAVRLSLATLTFLCTALGTWLFANAIAGDGFGLLDFALSTLFAILFLWVAFSFWTATLGLFVILRSSPSRHTAGEGELPNAALDLPPTAIVMPVYNEDPQLVFANVRAIAQSLRDTRQDAAFHVFVLSDTTDPDIWLEEERAWARFVADLPGHVRVFYRHRPQNTSRKAGNIADFCSRWGDHYRYMIVLDADSVMAGSTLVEMVRRMEQDPQLGILQVPPRPVNRQSVFARMQQFAASFYGPIFLEGFALWSECDGNYWGHNAIIRIRPFMEHCELPILPGEGPLSGEILSHDFVEAALMRRAGWKVCLAHDLEGSYEECPTTILDFAQRDQRWCQGNLQHIRLLLAEGLHPASRLHFGMGAMSYLASPLWLSFLVLTMLGAVMGSDVSAATVHGPSGVLLFLVTMALLLLPKVWSVLAAAHQPDTAPIRRTRALASVMMETVASTLIAPVMMLLHTRFVISTLLGQKVQWSAQQRDDRGVRWTTAAAVHYPHTLFGLAIAMIAWTWAPALLPWLSPVLLGMIGSIPLAVLLGSVRWGEWLARHKLLMIPEEQELPTVLRYQREALAPREAAQPDGFDPFQAVLRDPAFHALHQGILRATDGHRPLPASQLAKVQEAGRTSGFDSLSATERRAVLGDLGAMESLHVLVRSQLQPAPSVLLA